MDHAQAVAEVATATFTLTPTDTAVLKAVLDDYQGLEASLAKNKLDYLEKRFRRGPRVEFLDGKGVRIEHCRWADLDEHDPTISKRYQRAILKLAKLGLLERVRVDGYTKATHVRLTERAREEAERLQKLGD